jgi:hypothetical protein
MLCVELLTRSVDIFQGHNELILALLNQQQRGPADMGTALIPAESLEPRLESPVSELKEEEREEGGGEDALPEEREGPDISPDPLPSESDPSSTSFGHLLKKGAAAYSQSPAELAGGGGREKKQRVVSRGVMESEVLPFYGAAGSAGVPTEKMIPASSASASASRGGQQGQGGGSGQPSEVIAGVLVEVLQQLVKQAGGAGGQPSAPQQYHQHQHQHQQQEKQQQQQQQHVGSSEARPLPIHEENAYYSGTRTRREYHHEDPSEQRGQQYAPSSAWAKPLPSAWVNVSVPPAPLSRGRLRMSTTTSSVGSWDEDFHSSSSEVEDDYHSKGEPSRGLLLVDTHEKVLEREDPTLAMLRRDMQESHQHRSAIMKHHTTDINADAFDNESVDASWGVEGHAMYSSDSSLGSYRSLSALERRGGHSRGLQAQAPTRRVEDRGGLSSHPEGSDESWFDDDVFEEDKKRTLRGRSQRQATARNNVQSTCSLDASFELPTPLCSSILPCAATLHYANSKQQPVEGKDKGRRASRHHHTVEESFPSRDPGDHRALHLAPHRRPLGQDTSLSTYSSGDSDDHIPSYRQAQRPSYRPTLSDYEPSTPSTSTTSTLGSINFPRPSCMLRNKFEKKSSGDSDSKSGSGDDAKRRDGRGVHNSFLGVDSIDSEDSTTERYARFIADESSLDESSVGGKQYQHGRARSRSSNSNNNSNSNSNSNSRRVPEGDSGMRSVDSCSTCSDDDANSSLTGSSMSSDNLDLTLPRGQLRLWRPSSQSNRSSSSKRSTSSKGST